MIYGPELLNLGKEYPQGFSYFRPRLHNAFMANAALRDEEAIRKRIERAKFVQKGTSCFHHAPPPPHEKKRIPTCRMRKRLFEGRGPCRGG